MMTTPLENFLLRLQGVKPSGNGYMARCPSHDDSNPTLAISEADDGKVLLHCHAGCDYKNILQAIGLQESDLFPPSNGDGHRASVKPVAVASKKNITENTKKTEPLARLTPNDFPKLTRSEMSRSLKSGVNLECLIDKIKQRLVPEYGDSSATVHRYGDKRGVVRYDFHDGGKTFRPVHADANGRWTLGDGMEPWPLYQQDKIPESGTVILCEGEKCVDALAELGILAVTSPHGANATKKADVKALVGRDVCILPDCDVAGKKYTREMTSKLLVVGCRVKIVDLPGLGEGEDIADWIQAGGDAGRLAQLVESAPWIKQDDLENAFPFQKCVTNLGKEKQFKPLQIGEFYKNTPDKIEWVVEPLIPKGTLCALAGLMKAGKTELTLQLAASMERGGEFLGYPAQKTKILFLAIEGHPAELRRRFVSHGVPEGGGIFIHTGRLQNTFEQAAEIAEFVKAHDIGLVVLDSWAAFSGVDDENSNMAVLEALQPVRQIIEATGTAILLIVHAKKSGGSHGTQIRGAGSLFGELDQALILERRQGGATTNRVLSVIGRYSESPPEAIIDYVGGQYVSLGAPVKVKGDEADERILAVLDDEPLDIASVAVRSGVNAMTTRRVLERLHQADFVQREGTGMKGSPFKYYGEQA